MGRRIIFGVDAGGTTSVAWMATVQPDGDLKILGRGSAGPGNPLRIGRGKALDNVFAAISSATLDAGLPISDASHVVVGMAGAGRFEIQTEVSLWLRQQTAIQQIDVIPDIELILPAAFSDGEGIAVISGTGSIVNGVRGNRRTRVGGWGFRVDDQGSGHWFGQAALQAIARAEDGRGPNTAISELICAKFGEASVSAIIASLYDSPNQPSQDAVLAPIVFQAAATGDEVANQIIGQGAQALAEMIEAAAHQVGFAQDEIPLAGAGGVLLGAPVFQECLLTALNNRSICPVKFECVGEPVLGALRLASLSNRSE